MTRDELFNKCNEQDNTPPVIKIPALTPLPAVEAPPAPEIIDGK